MQVMWALVVETAHQHARHGRVGSQSRAQHGWIFRSLRQRDAYQGGHGGCGQWWHRSFRQRFLWRAHVMRMVHELFILMMVVVKCVSGQGVCVNG